jgi:hypothetical protein
LLSAESGLPKGRTAHRLVDLRLLLDVLIRRAIQLPRLRQRRCHIINLNLNLNLNLNTSTEYSHV